MQIAPNEPQMTLNIQGQAYQNINSTSTPESQTNPVPLYD